MATYGLKYQSQFDSISDANNPSRRYTLQFLFKDYTGDAVSVLGGATAVIQKCTVEDPFAPIKGQSLSIQLINEGNIPITSFYSEDDDGIQVKLFDENNNLLFIGFLVQDDFYEGMIDYEHPITLSATDSLGLLKGVILSEARVKRGYLAQYVTDVDLSVIHVNVLDTAFYPEIGDTIEIASISYTITSATAGQHLIGVHVYNWAIGVTPATTGIAYDLTTIYLTGEINLINRNNLLSIIAVCLASTNLPLTLNIFHNYYEYRQGTGTSTFEQTIIDSQLFISGETYDDCYSVLSKILAAFQCTLFQANGCWNIINWYEAKLYPLNAINGFVYDETFLYLGTTTFNNNFFIGPDPQLTQPIYELVQGGVRGWKFSRKTFNYNSPKYLLKNYDLLKLGALRSDYVSLGIRYKEYTATDWTGGDTPTYVDRFIRVASDPGTGTEINRTLVVKGDPGSLSYSKSVRSQPIECHVGDKIKVSFSVRGQNSFTGTWTLEYAIMLTDGTNIRYVDDLPANNGDWISTIGFEYNGSGTNTDQWHDVEIQSSQMPYSGLLYVYLTELYGNGDETQYKDIRFEYTPYISDSTKITGQIHKQNQLPNKKLNNDVDIVIDDSPRNAIVGTLFLNTVTSLLQDRTTFWRHPQDGINGWRLGELSTLLELTWRQKTRSKLEGGFTGLWQNGVPASLLMMGITDFAPNKNYIFGLLDIDYKNNSFNGQLWELYDNTDPDFDPDYTLSFIYSTT